jgi:integrase
VDKDPEWRARAIHTRDELEMMISDQRLPEWRRMFWSLLFLTGMRFGEAAARRWRHYQPDSNLLGKLVVNTSGNSDLEKEKETKTKQPRDVPVHLLLREPPGRVAHPGDGSRSWVGNRPTTISSSPSPSPASSSASTSTTR